MVHNLMLHQRVLRHKVHLEDNQVVHRRLKLIGFRKIVTITRFVKLNILINVMFPLLIASEFQFSIFIFEFSTNNLMWSIPVT